MRLLVTGATGLLGVNLCLVATRQGHKVTGVSHTRVLNDSIPFDLSRIDLTDLDKAVNIIDALKPEAIIHCAAMADLNTAQNAAEDAYRINCEAPAALAAAACRWGLPFIHVSTDAVFDGKSGGYREEDPVNPLSVYAQTKLAGEKVVSFEHPDAIIARVVFFGWSISGVRSLSEFFYNNLSQGKKVKGFVDTFFSPLYAEDLAEIFLEMLEKDLKGVFHVVSPESLSKYDFGFRIAKKFGYDPGLIEPEQQKSAEQMTDLARGAPRSLKLDLNPEKVQKALGHPLPTVTEGIQRFYERWLEKYPHILQGFRVKS